MDSLRPGSNGYPDGKLVVTDFFVEHDELNDGVRINCTRSCWSSEVNKFSLNQINGIANVHAELAHG